MAFHVHFFCWIKPSNEVWTATFFVISFPIHSHDRFFFWVDFFPHSEAELARIATFFVDFHQLEDSMWAFCRLGPFIVFLLIARNNCDNFGRFGGIFNRSTFSLQGDKMPRCPLPFLNFSVTNIERERNARPPTCEFIQAKIILSLLDSQMAKYSLKHYSHWPQNLLLNLKLKKSSIKKNILAKNFLEYGSDPSMFVHSFHFSPFTASSNYDFFRRFLLFANFLVIHTSKMIEPGTLYLLFYDF